MSSEKRNKWAGTPTQKTLNEMLDNMAGKWDIMNQKHIESRELLIWIPEPFIRYYDEESTEFIDEKIEVMHALKAGKTVDEIPNFYKILELLPREGTWD